MRLSRRQLRRLIESALHEQSGLSANPFGEPSAADSEKELADMRLPSRTYDYGDGYTYVVINDMWHVIRGGKKMAEKTSDYISMKKYQKNMLNLDEKFPEARSAAAKSKTKNIVQQQDDIISGRSRQRPERSSEELAKIKEIETALTELDKLVKKNDFLTDIDSGNIKQRGYSPQSQSVINSKGYKDFIKAHKDMKALIEERKDTIEKEDRDANPDYFKRKFLDAKTAYVQAFLSLKKMEKHSSPKLKLQGKLLDDVKSSVTNTRKIDELIQDIVDKEVELKKVLFPTSNPQNSGGSTSGSSQVAVQKEGLSRGSMYRRRYRRY